MCLIIEIVKITLANILYYYQDNLTLCFPKIVKPLIKKFRKRRKSINSINIFIKTRTRVIEI